MGTLVHIRARGSAATDVERAIEAAFEAVELTERLMSFHCRASELSRLNRSAHQHPQPVHRWTGAVLSRALRIAAASDGLFDVTVAPVLVRDGLLPASDLDVPDAGASWRDLRLLPGPRVFYARPMLLDLGGIAKGFAVDQAIHALRQHGCSAGTVNAGGDLRRFGAEHEAIHLGLRDSTAPLAELRVGAIATSAARAGSPERLAQPLGHIVDPRSARRWAWEGGVSVAASTCVIADALTKVAALAGPASRSLLARFGAQALWWHDASGRATPHCSA
jgi:thiamine biosynthesis lipoprotein